MYSKDKLRLSNALWGQQSGRYSSADHLNPSLELTRPSPPILPCTSPPLSGRSGRGEREAAEPGLGAECLQGLEIEPKLPWKPGNSVRPAVLSLLIIVAGQIKQGFRRDPKGGIMKNLILACLIVILGGVLSAQTDPEWLWAVRAGGSGNEWAYSIDRDNDGNLYVSGVFTGTATFGTTQITSIGSNEVFVAKLSPEGTWLWARRAGSQYEDRCLSIATDSSGNSYISGFFYGTADFGSTSLTSAGGRDAFLAKLDTHGNWLWAIRAGGASNDDALRCTVNNSGFLYLVGNFGGTASFGTLTLTSLGGDDLFIGRLAPDGSWMWVRRAGGSGYEEGDCVATNSNGDCFISGYFSDTAEFGSAEITSVNSYDIFVARLDNGGTWLWAQQAGGLGVEGGWAVTADDNGYSCVTGPFQNEAWFGLTQLTCVGSQDIFVARLDPTGHWLWARRAGGDASMGDNTDVGCEVATDASGHTFNIGYYYGATANFGTHLVLNSGLYDIYVARLDGAGNWQWVVHTGSPTYDSGWGICLDSQGNSYTSGCFSGTTVFGGTELVSAGERDIFVAKLSPGVVGVDDDLVPDASAVSRLYDAYPNPFRAGDTAQIKAHIADRESGTLSIYNLRGELISSQVLGSGTQQISLDGKGLPAGIYLYQLKTQTVTAVKKLVLLK